MSNDLLTQDEIDALLKGVQSGEIDTETAKEKILTGIRPYDFTSQERIVRGRMPGLEMSNERFTRFFRNSLSSLLMRHVDIGSHSYDIIKFGEFLRTIPFPSSINIFKINPLKGYSILLIEAPVVFAFVEFFFGSNSARLVKSEGRAFTAIEQRIIKNIVTAALTDFAKAWSGISEIVPELVGSEMNPQLITIVTPSEIVIKITISLEIEDFSGKIYFCIPYSMIEPVKEKLYSSIQSDKFELDIRWSEKIKETILNSDIEISVELGRTNLSVEDVLNLQVGSIIILNNSTKEDIFIKVKDKAIFAGLPGYSRGSQAVKVTKILR
ncbi:MAG: flagellar motor switch protein FliM [Thermodesulfovibrionales bacterium]|nr:flagellar motor switch protein FliM [Thermodesulfovibrionales bacterium]